MKNNINNITMTGHLTHDAECKKTESGCKEVCIVGSLRQKRSKNTDGKTQSWISIVVDKLELLGGKKAEVSNSDEKGDEFFEFTDEDIPF